MEATNEMDDPTIYVTLEQGATGWLARVLEPGQPPEYFVPSLVKYGAFLTKTTLCRALKEAHGEGIVFAEEGTFNKLATGEKHDKKSQIPPVSK